MKRPQDRNKLDMGEARKKIGQGEWGEQRSASQGPGLRPLSWQLSSIAMETRQRIWAKTRFHPGFTTQTTRRGHRQAGSRKKPSSRTAQTGGAQQLRLGCRRCRERCWTVGAIQSMCLRSPRFQHTTEEGKLETVEEISHT